MQKKWTISAAVIFQLGVSATLIDWHSFNVLSWVKLIAAIVVIFVYMVFLVWLALTCVPLMSITNPFLFDVVFIAGSATVLIRLLEFSEWAATFVSIGIAEALSKNAGMFAVVNCGGLAAIALAMTSLCLTKQRAAVLGLFQTLGCKLRSIYDFLDSKEEKEQIEAKIKIWEQSEIFREANPLHPKWQDYDDTVVRRFLGLPSRPQAAVGLTRRNSF